MRVNNQETLNTWNKVAALYESKFMQLDMYDDTYDTLLSMLKPSQINILEIGCGPGNISRYIMQAKPNLNYTAIDYAEKMVNIAQKNNPNVDFKVMDCHNIDQFNQKFDVIICGFLWPYLSKKDSLKLMYDAWNLLSNDGFLYLSFVDGQYEDSGFISGSSEDSVYFYFHPMKQIKSQLKALDFEIMYSIEKQYPKSKNLVEKHTIIIAKKID